MTVNTKSASKYAVIFRVHFWDAYADRQYQRLCSVVGRGDVFILVSETDAHVPYPNVIYFKQKCALDLGLNGFVEGGPFFWFNADYPIYIFYDRHSHYDFYVFAEYDAVIQRNLDDIVDRLEREGIDFVGQTMHEVGDWYHLHTCLETYSEDQVLAGLLCIAMFSNRAIRHLFARRVAMSTQYRAGALRRWPYCEAFIPTEIAIAGLKMAELTEFGSTDRYDWRPAVLEMNLRALAQQGFVHPVLPLRHFVQLASRRLLKNLSNPWGLCRVLLNLCIRPLAQKSGLFTRKRRG